MAEGFASQENRGGFPSLSGFCHNLQCNVVPAIGGGAMTIADYIAIGVLIVLGIFAAAAAANKLKL
jgi:hypothetical protein